MEGTDKELLVNHLRKIIKHCDSKKEPMRNLRIAGPSWRHQASGKSAAYDEVKNLLKKLGEELGISAELAEDFTAAEDELIGFASTSSKANV